MKIETTSPRRHLFVLTFLLMYTFMGNMLSVFYRHIPYRDMIGIAVTCIGIFILFYSLSMYSVSSKNVLLPLAGFACLAALVTGYSYYLERGASASYTIRMISESIRWIAVFSWAYYIGFQEDAMTFKARGIAYTTVVFMVLFLGVKDFSANRGIPLISTAYYALFLLPFIFLIRNKAVMWCLVACVFYPLLLSMKRTGFVAFLLGILCYFIVDIRMNNRVDKKKGQRQTISAILVILVFFLLLMYITENQGYSVLDRMDSIEEDRGSGRIELWVHILEMIKDSELASMLLGHGYNTVYWDSGLDVSAHTDVLEVIYDYGILGTLLYLLFYIRLWGYFKNICSHKPRYAASFAVSLVLVFCTSLASHLLILPTYFLFLCLFWGMITGEVERTRVRSFT